MDDLDFTPASDSLTTGSEPTVDSNPLLEYLTGGANDSVPDPEPQPQPSVESQQPSEQELILGKFKSQEELINSYVEAQRKITEQGQTVSEIQKQLQELQKYMQPQQQQPQQPEMTPEQIEQINEQFYQDLVKNPVPVLMKFVDEVASAKVAPILQQYEQQQAVEYYNQQVEQVRSQFADFDELRPMMADIIKEQGQYLSTLPNAVQTTYELAKARSVKSPDQLLSDPNFLQKVMQNEQVKTEILKTYAQQVQQTQTPVVIGSQPTGVSPSTPPVELKTTSDAKRASMSFFQRLLGE